MSTGGELGDKVFTEVGPTPGSTKDIFTTVQPHRCMRSDASVAGCTMAALDAHPDRRQRVDQRTDGLVGMSAQSAAAGPRRWATASTLTTH